MLDLIIGTFERSAPLCTRFTNSPDKVRCEPVTTFTNNSHNNDACMYVVRPEVSRQFGFLPHRDSRTSACLNSDHFVFVPVFESVQKLMSISTGPGMRCLVPCRVDVCLAVVHAAFRPVISPSRMFHTYFHGCLGVDVISIYIAVRTQSVRFVARGSPPRLAPGAARLACLSSASS